MMIADAMGIDVTGKKPVEAGKHGGGRRCWPEEKDRLDEAPGLKDPRQTRKAIPLVELTRQTGRSVTIRT